MPKPPSPANAMAKFLKGLGCRRRKEIYSLDGFDTEFYLVFDATPDLDHADLAGTADIYIAGLESHPTVFDQTKIRIKASCQIQQIARFIFALGINRFPIKTRKFLHEQFDVIRSAGMQS